MELLLHIIMSACVLHTFCLLHEDFDDNYFLDHHDGDGYAGGHPNGALATDAKQVR